MNNPNPFVPKGSLLEQQNKRRMHMKVGVLCVLAVSVAGLMVMLIQGCKKQPPEDTTLTDTNAVSTADTNTPATDLSNQPPVSATNVTAMVPSPNTPVPNGAPGSVPNSPLPNTAPQSSPIVVPTPVLTTPTVTPVTPEAGGSEYVVAKGDILSKIARKNGVTLKALEAANPDVKPTKLKVGQKLVIPEGGKSVADAGSGATSGASDGESETYTVKSGDTLTKIAKAHHVKLKALQAANNLSTTKIKVGQKLKIPGKAEVAAAPVDSTTTAPTVDNSMPAPPVPMVNTAPAASPSAAPAPAPAHN